MRTINYTITADAITPNVSQQGGVQGDDNVTDIRFDVTGIHRPVPYLKYRLEFTTGAGTFGSSEHLTVTSSVTGAQTRYFVATPLTSEMTMAGGRLQLHLVQAKVDENGGEEAIYYSFPAKIHLTASAQDSSHVEGYKRGITGIMLTAEKFKHKTKELYDSFSEKEASLRAGVVSANEVASAAQTALAKTNETVADINGRVAAQDFSITQTNGALVATRETVRSLQSEVEQQTAEINERVDTQSAQITQANNTITSTRDDVRDLDSQVGQLNVSVNQRFNALDFSLSQTNMMLSSTREDLREVEMCAERNSRDIGIFLNEILYINNAIKGILEDIQKVKLAIGL